MNSLLGPVRIKQTKTTNFIEPKEPKFDILMMKLDKRKRPWIPDAVPKQNLNRIKRKIFSKKSDDPKFNSVKYCA